MHRRCPANNHVKLDSFERNGLEQYAPNPYQDGVGAIRLELDRNADRSRRRMRKWNRLDGRRPAAAAAPRGRHRNVVVYVLLDAHRARVDKVNVHSCLFAGRHQVRFERKVDVQRALLCREHLGVDLGVRRHAGHKRNQCERGQRHHGLHIHGLAAPCIKHCPCRLRALGSWIRTAGRSRSSCSRGSGALKLRTPAAAPMGPSAGGRGPCGIPRRCRRRPSIPLRPAMQVGIGRWMRTGWRLRLEPTRLRRGRQAKGTE